jgi:hypothetical protein
MEFFKVKISPEVLQNDIIYETYSGYTFGVYSGLTSILKGGPDGSSLLTGLTIPILLKQKYQDIGYYDGFDGKIKQENISANFLFYSTLETPYTYKILNTSDNENVYLFNSTYQVDWGDGTTQTITTFYPEEITHNYSGPLSQPTEYTITLTQTNLWGIIQVKKNIVVPYSIPQNTDQYGTVTFANTNGSWSATPSSYNFIFTGDAYNQLAYQVSSFYTEVPFFVTGFTTSRLNDLATYGPSQFVVGQTVPLPQREYGMVESISNGYTAYTINEMTYQDFPDGTTIFVLPSSGMTTDMFSVSAITKNEALMNVIDQPQLYNSVFVERGKNSGVENFLRLGEVSNLSDLLSYGYNYFIIKQG